MGGERCAQRSRCGASAYAERGDVVGCTATLPHSERSHGSPRKKLRMVMHRVE
jgi:hypothetical protein